MSFTGFIENNQTNYYYNILYNIYFIDNKYFNIRRFKYIRAKLSILQITEKLF